MLLHEEILLLALRDETGKIDWKAGHFRTAMAGAIIAELLFAERISVSDDRRKLVTLLDGSAHEDVVLNESVELIGRAKRRRNIQHWIGKLAMLKHLKEKAAASLCKQQILDADERRFLLIFDTISFPERNPEPERKLIARLKQAIFSDDDQVDARTTVLISLASSAGMLAIPFSGAEIRKRKKRIAEITSGNLIGAATSEVIQAAQAALMAAAIIPAIGVATTSSSGSPGR